MKLSTLLDAIETRERTGPADVEITGIATNSRSVDRGSLFVALKGTRTDGHMFIDEAIARGAAACVCEVPPPAASVPCAVVDDSSKALAALAARFFGNPADDLMLCGVTGTNGKTSTAHLLRSICEASSWGAVGIIGTIGHGSGGSLEPATHTTPDPVKLHELFAGMKKNGCLGVVMEVSSHAVRQQRTWGLEFVVGILTNVTRDHLDFHKTFEDYRSAKQEFCLSLVDRTRKRNPGFLVYGADDVKRGLEAVR
ncbi:MAG: UDP-N-acetylmuramoyl-L-alanyl-D-glutamate--2,6-diaminopimelate ligase, partial [Chitinivibrionia bacterium]|nr:UDP-N-acetylmuramoyl-L-alanyl-D-glutamate--2,6-diaminopimelate ligase [Chitinivibrionia bacterium]